MREETQVGHMPTPSKNSNNQTKTNTERAIRRVSHKNTNRNKTKKGILNTLKGSVPEVGEVLRTKDENFKKSFQKL